MINPMPLNGSTAEDPSFKRFKRLGYPDSQGQHLAPSEPAAEPDPHFICDR